MANARTVSVRLRAEVAEFIGGMKAAGESAKGFKDELAQASKKGNLDSVATAAAGAGVALAAMAGYAVKAGMDFDKQMSAVKAATHASAGAMGDLRQAALDAGAATVFSATDAAKAETELAKAGLSATQILSGGLSGALSLAAAGELDVGEAAETAASALTQFGLQGKDVPHVADLLAAGAGKAQGEVHDLAQALNQSGLVAAQFGLSIEETTGTLAAFAAAGMLGSDAGTSLKTMLLRLASPSSEAADTMRQLGIHAYDAQGKFVGLKDFAGQLKTSMEGLTGAERDQAMATIFGSDAVRAANILFKNGAEGIADWTNKVNDSGYAADTAAAKTDNLAGDLERLKGSIETVAIASGSGASGGLRTLVQLADGMVGAFSALPSPVQSSATVIAGLGGAALLATAGMLKVRGVVGDALKALSDMGPTGQKASGALGTVASGLGKVAAAATAAEAGILLVGAAWRAFTDNPKEKSISELADGLRRLGEGSAGLNVLGKSAHEVEKDLETLANNGLDNFANRWSAFVDGISGTGDLQGTFTKARADVGKLDTALASLVSSGHTKEANEAFDRLTEAAKRQGVSLNELKAGFPQYQEALSGATASEQASIAATQNHQMALATMAGTLQNAVDRTGSLKAAFDALNGVHINSIQAEAAVEQAVDALTESLQRNGATLDLNTQGGRDNALAATDVATKARDVAQAKYDETGSLEIAKGAYDGYIGKLHDTLRAAGFTEDQVGALITRIGQMPPLKSTTFETPGLVQANNTATGYKRTMDDLDGRVVSTVIAEIHRTTYTSDIAPSNYFRGNRWGGITEHAQSGLLRDADIYSSVASGARYAFAEPGTGGEAFVPRNGNYARSAAILDRAARWYGGRFMPGGATQTGAERGDVTVNVYPPTGASTSEIVALVKRDLAWEL